MHNTISLYKYYTPELANYYSLPERANMFSTPRSQLFKLDKLNDIKFEDSATLNEQLLSGFSGMANCCGAHFSVENSDYTYYMPITSRESYCRRVETGSRGILVIGDHTNKTIPGTTKHRYSLGKYKFDVHLNTVDLEEWFYTQPICEYGKLPRQAGNLGYTYTEHKEKSVIDYSTPILSVYYSAVVAPATSGGEALSRILDTGCPVILIGAKRMSSWDGIRRVIEEQGLKRYLVDYHENIFNMNYLERRLNMFILYKDI